MPPPSPGPKPGPVPIPMPPPLPDPMPPPDPGPFDAAPILPKGSPYCSGFTFGSCTSGGPMRVGSMASFGSRLATTAIGGVNCFSANLGARPRNAGNSDRSPPPPPPDVLGLTVADAGTSEDSAGATSTMEPPVIRCLTVGVSAAVNTKTTTADCSPTDITHDFLCRPYWPQMFRTKTGLDVISSSGGAG